MQEGKFREGDRVYARDTKTTAPVVAVHGQWCALLFDEPQPTSRSYTERDLDRVEASS